MTRAHDEAIFELADQIVNEDGYADSEADNELRTELRNDLFNVIDGTIKQWKEDNDL